MESETGDRKQDERQINVSYQVIKAHNT